MGLSLGSIREAALRKCERKGEVPWESLGLRAFTLQTEKNRVYGLKKKKKKRTMIFILSSYRSQVVHEMKVDVIGDGPPCEPQKRRKRVGPRILISSVLVLNCKRTNGQLFTDKINDPEADSWITQRIMLATFSPTFSFGHSPMSS